MIRSFLYKATSVAMITAATAAVATTASAQPFANVLNVVGQAQISSPGAGSGFPLFIDFLSGGAYPPGTVGNGSPGNVFSGATTGVFNSITGGSNGIIQDLVVSAGGTTTTTNPSTATSFMTIGGYTFTFGSAPAGTTFGPVSLEDRTGGAIASFAVFGNVSGSGFAPGTTYEGLFTAQFVGLTSAQVLAQLNGGQTQVVTFSANFGAPLNSVVPEPSTYALLATGLGALGVAVRRRRTLA